MATLLPRLRLDPGEPPPSPLDTLFEARCTRFRLEIGFGSGEHLLARARQNPATGFIGVEPFINGLARFLRRFAREPLANIRIYDGAAGPLLDWLPPVSVDQVDLLYCDPWPKKRHFKRRFVSPQNLGRIARALRPGGFLCFASDIDSYVNWTLRHCRRHPAFEWQAASARDWRVPFEGWPGTRYEAKALREGRASAYLTFRRV